MNYIHKDGKALGPFSNEKIIEFIEAKTIMLSDFIYCDSHSDWYPVYRLPFLSSFYNLKKPSFIPDVKNNNPDSDDEIKKLNGTNSKNNLDIKLPTDIMKKDWFILRANKKYGPFKYLDLIKMLNSNSLVEHDYIWNKNFKSWNKVSDLQAFSPYYVDQVKNNYFPEEANLLFRRKHQRIKYDSNIFINDNDRYWVADGNDLSPGGTSITIHSSFGDTELNPGDTVNLHFKAQENIPCFNAKAEIVSKWFRDKEFKSSPLCYCLKFNKINKEIEDYLTKLCREKQKAA